MEKLCRLEKGSERIFTARLTYVSRSTGFQSVSAYACEARVAENYSTLLDMGFQPMVLVCWVPKAGFQAIKQVATDNLSLFACRCLAPQILLGSGVP
jgi:hypothetical protein